MKRRDLMRARWLSALAVALAVALAAGFSRAPIVSAQQQLDRTKIPAPGKTPVLHVPAWTKSTLADGADFIVSEKHDLPLVSFSITFLGGANQVEPAGLRGIGPLTASMLSEGTRARDGEALSNALQLLGTTVNVAVGAESGSMGFVSTTANFPAALDILDDMLVNSTFPAQALERLRAQRLVALNQAKAQPAAIAGRVFPRVLYGPSHPLGQSPTEASISAITRDQVVAFYRSYFRPARALVTVVGDVNGSSAKAMVERALSSWQAGGDKPAFAYPPLPAPRPTTIFLVDKPAAPQSTFAIGLPGPPRDTPDYFAIQVMNTILGGQFQSRLNANIREDKGYSYGVASSFGFGKGPNPFRGGGDMTAGKTDLALVEFMKELRGITGAKPITDEELTTAKDALVQRLPATFASVGGINAAITNIWTQSLPDDYYQQYAKAIAAVTKNDVLRVARTYIDVDHLAIVIVGDRASIEAPLKATAIAPIAVLDIEGAPAGQ
jgi:predicted Zn-dependent peptidase